MAMSAWPRSSCTSLGCTPRERSKVAAVRRRLWKKDILGSPVFFKSGHHERLVRLWQFAGVPLVVEKTHWLPFPRSRCVRRASLAIPVERMERSTCRS